MIFSDIGNLAGTILIVMMIIVGVSNREYGFWTFFVAWITFGLRMTDGFFRGEWTPLAAAFFTLGVIAIMVATNKSKRRTKDLKRRIHERYGSSGE